MVQTKEYDIVKAHGGTLNVEAKRVREVNLLFNYQLCDRIFKIIKIK